MSNEKKENKYKDLPKKIRALKRLSEEGATVGERENAREKMIAILDAYGLELDEVGIETKERHSFTYRTKFERLLLLQVHNYVKSENSATYWSHGRSKKLSFDLTPSQAVDFDIAYEHFRRKFRKDLDLFFRAFILKNEIWNRENVGKGTSREDADQDLLTVWEMAGAIKQTSPNKQLTE